MFLKIFLLKSTEDYLPNINIIKNIYQMEQENLESELFEW